MTQEQAFVLRASPAKLSIAILSANLARVKFRLTVKLVHLALLLNITMWQTSSAYLARASSRLTARLAHLVPRVSSSMVPSVLPVQAIPIFVILATH